MSEKNKQFKEVIKAYLDKRAQEDELFAKAYAKPMKDIDSCCKYIISMARGLGNAVAVPDEVVYGWAVHYYDEEGIKIDDAPDEAARWEAEYREKKGMYFGIVFGNERITVSVVQSVADMAEEGANMRHCVYENGYYKKDDSLILSARDNYGNRMETIEVSLKTFEVVQSRGVCNSKTEHHDEIVALVNRNMNLIRAAS